MQGVFSKNLYMPALFWWKKSCSWLQFQFVFPGVEIISILYDQHSLLNSIICHTFCRSSITIEWTFAIACFEVVPSSRSSRKLFMVSDDVKYLFVMVLWCWQIYSTINDVGLIPWLYAVVSTVLGILLEHCEISSNTQIMVRWMVTCWIPVCWLYFILGTLFVILGKVHLNRHLCTL